MPSRRVLALVLLAVLVRLASQAWDAGGLFPHPDERQVAFVAERTAGWFTDPGFYAYGSLHFQAVRAMAFVLGLPQAYGGLIVAGRAMSLVLSVVALLLAWWIARRAWGRRAGVLVLALGAWVPLDLQQSHYATVEAHHAAWVMATLAAAFWLARRPSWLPALLTGAAAGASLAVKVSSLALGLPVALACIVAARARPMSAVRWLAAAGAASASAFWLAQPSAFEGSAPPVLMVLSLGVTALAAARSETADGSMRRIGMAAVAVALVAAVVAGLTIVAPLAGSSSASAQRWLDVIPRAVGPPLAGPYLAGVSEQVRMVAGEADLAYVRVFAGTLPVLYPLRELAAWGSGPALLAAVLLTAGVGVWWLGRRWRRTFAGRPGDGTLLLLLVLAWLVPMAARLATLQVKFLRYWEPLAIPAVMVAAWGLSRLPRRVRRPIVAGVVGGTVVWGLAFVWAFAMPHPHGIASAWLSPMVASSDTVAFEHWDETLRLQGAAASARTLQLPSYDLPDSADKARRWADTLAEADWVVLTSNRVRRTVLVNPDRFERTARLYALLFAGEAGFEPVARVDRAPRLFGLRAPVQVADESFVNYDFPRVVVLRRSGPTDVEDLVERVDRPLPFLEGLGPRELERRFVEPLPSVPAVPGLVRQAVDVVLWLAVFGLWTAAAWVLLRPLTRGLPDAGAGLAAVTGWIVPSWTLWMGSELGVWSVGASTATVLTLTASAVALRVAWRRRRELVEDLRRHRRGILSVVMAAVAVGVLFGVVRAFNPAIHWGEKPMDFSFLNAFLRADAWPTGEPWMAGMPLHYYYFGEVLAATPILVVGCTAAVGYNLMSATVPALSAALLAGLGLGLSSRRRRVAWVLPVLVLLTGNLAWPWLLPMAWQRASSWLDLGAVRWFDMWWATSRVIPGFAIDEYPLWTALFADLHGHFLALPVLLAALWWGWRTALLPGRRGLVAAGVCAVSAAVLVATNPWDVFVLAGALGLAALVVLRRPVAGLGRLAFAGVLSVLACLPFVLELLRGLRAGAGGGRMLFLTAADFAPAWAVVQHFGVFLVPLVVVAAASLGRRWLTAAPLAVVGALLGLSFGSSAAALGLALVPVFAMAIGKRREPAVRLAWSMAALGMAAVAACERFTLIDRMNTLFKIYNGVWVLLAFALAVLLVRGRRRALTLAVWMPLEVVALVNLPLGIVQGVVEPRQRSPRPTLDGQAFLPRSDPQTWFLVRSLQGVARPDDVVAEAAGEAYSRYTRIAMHTGQPTVVGWPWHLQQRGQARREVDARYADLETLYAGGDPQARRRVLDRYRVRWVVVAAPERLAYDLESEDPLAGVPGVRRFASSGDAALYWVGDEPSAIGSSATAPSVAVPAGMTALPRLAVPRPPPFADVTLAGPVAVAVGPDGGLLVIDRTGTVAQAADGPGCRVTAVAAARGVTWVACADGRVLRRETGPWTPDGRMPDGGAGALTAGDGLWAWGDGGLWSRDAAGRWIREVAHPVRAAAAAGAGIAYSDGSTVAVRRPGGPSRAVAAPRRGVVRLAWNGPELWVLDATGLARSPGAILPWRSVAGDVSTATVLAGGPDRLWLLADDGTFAETRPLTCDSPFAASSGGERGLREPRGVAVSSAGWFVVADTFGHRVRWYAPDGTCLDQLGGEGADPGRFREPSGVAVSPQGAVAVTDTWNGRVQVLQPDGSIQVLGGELYGPRGVMWDDDGTLWVADTGNRRVLRYRLPSSVPDLTVELDAPVVGLARLPDSVAAAVPAAGMVVRLDAMDGRRLGELPVPGWTEGLQQEGYLAVLDDGTLLASAPHPGELWRLDPAGGAPVLVRDDVEGLTALAIGEDGAVIGALTWQHRLVRLGRLTTADGGR